MLILFILVTPKDVLHIQDYSQFKMLYYGSIKVVVL